MIDFLEHIALDWLLFSSDKPWLFTGFSFWIFFAVVMGIYSIVDKKVRHRNFYLLLVSLFFYYKTGGWFCILLIFSSLSNYTWGIILGKVTQRALKFSVLFAGILMNLFLLAYFKYAYFFTDIVNHFTGDAFETYNWLAVWWNSIANASIDTTDIILPIGISFFTFQAISYLVDVHKQRTEVVKNVFDFSFYLSFFPQLVAGPIVRASSFIPQLYQTYRITKQEFGHALFLILAGLIKKMVISDYLALNFIDRIFEQPGSFSGVENLTAIYAYALQIYCDFSGYTDIAIGVALLLGFKLPINFNSPYKARSLSDFWHRWHISLSTWLRDYLYIPLGGNRKGKLRTYIHLLITMLLGGLWHGAQLKFIIWGGIHGIGLVVEKILKPLCLKIPDYRLKRFLSVFFTFQLVSIGWVFFRSKSLDVVQQIFHQIFYAFQPKVFLNMVVSYPMVIGILFIGFLIHWLPGRWQEWVRGTFIGIPLWGKGLIVLAVLYVLHLFLQTDIQPFIYFRF